MSSHGAMACPACNVALVLSDRQSIEIDYCPKCRGVWLDRGELDKIIERSVAALPPTGPLAGPPPAYRQEPAHRPESGYHGKRRKSFLEELFD